MKIIFYKYQGTGNDFVLLDNRDGAFDRLKSSSVIARLCDRRFGIGADGLIMLENAEEADFRMVYFNADGGLSTMCGNGGRCIAAFAARLGMVRDHSRFLAADGPHEAWLSGHVVSLRMRDVPLVERMEGDYLLDTGSPHYVRFVDSLLHFPVVETGRAVRYSVPFRQHGVNVNFVHSSSGAIEVATYERGVEDETYSCGTGVTAAALAHMIHSGYAYGSHRLTVQTKGGQLEVSASYSKTGFTHIDLTGPAELVFEGSLDSAILGMAT